MRVGLYILPWSCWNHPIALPPGAVIRAVGAYDGQATLFVEENVNAMPHVTRRFSVLDVGSPMPNDLLYVGAAIGVDLVFHSTIAKFVYEHPQGDMK